MLFTKGYDAKSFCNATNNDVMNKAIMRANMELPNSTPKGNFCYLAGLPKDLLKNCVFQNI